jgi:hypothetical protein
LVEPVGYESMWQKFENDVFNTVKQEFQGDENFKVQWNWPHVDLYPDVLISIRCKSCQDSKDDFPCLVAVIIFDAYCKWKIEAENFKKKEAQMEKYAEICDTVLVMPEGYQHRPFCKGINGRYHIISRNYLPIFMNSLKEAIEIDYKEDSCGYKPIINLIPVYKHFELSIRANVDKCPSCGQRAIPVSLIYCQKFNEYFYPDFLDCESIKQGVGSYTYFECDECGHGDTLEENYENCHSSRMEYKFQCEKCGAIFDPDTEAIIENFDDAHLDRMRDSFTYYKERKKIVQ